MFAEYAPAQLLQRFALATFYYATNGEDWNDHSGWLEYDQHECQWFFSDQTYSAIVQSVLTSPNGSPCDENDNDKEEKDVLLRYNPYVKLWMNNNGLAGTLPPEMYWLTSLKSIDLSLQNMEGNPKYPTLLASWEEAVTYESAVEAFGGPVTSYFPDTTPMSALGGTISSYIGGLTQLQELKLSGNSFTGSLPSEVGLLTQLSLEIRLMGNLFTGTIPTELHMLSSLKFIALSLNLFSGTVRTGFLDPRIWAFANLMFLYFLFIA